MTPTRVRYQVLILACLLAAITYLDRACFGVAAEAIRIDLGLTSVADLKWTFTAFAIAYGLFEVPTGWWGDRFGPRQVLIRVVLWWSFFTAMTGLVGNWMIAGYAFSGLAMLVVVRFLFGAGEAGAFPNIARALQNWFPPHARARAQGCVWMTARLAGGLTPLVWTFLVAGTAVTAPVVSWRGGFILFGIVGILWCLAFAWRFRNRPEEHPKVNQAERELITAGQSEPQAHVAVPWTAILFNRNLVCMYLMYFGITYGWFFNMTYLPDCLETRYDVPKTSVIGSLYKGGPLILGAVGCLLGGYLTDMLLRRGASLRWSRRLPGLVGLVLCSLCYLTAAWMPVAWSFALAIALAAFFNDLVMGGVWSTCQDVGGRHTAVVAGCLNTAASIAAAIAAWTSGAVLQWYLDARALALGVEAASLKEPQWAADRSAALMAGYETNLFIYAGVTALAALIWLGSNAERPVRGRDD